MRSEAQKRADKKYKESGNYKYKTIGVKIHSDNLDQLASIASSSSLTVPKYMARAAFYCAINNIDLTEFDQDFRSKDNRELQDPDSSKPGK